MTLDVLPADTGLRRHNHVERLDAVDNDIERNKALVETMPRIV